MLTTRLKDVALHAQSDESPLCLRFRTEEESFDLFRIKTFKDGHFFDNLSLIGKCITRKCHGLPLAIVVIAGILENNFEVDWWASVAESVGSYIVTDKDQYMDTLALSYNHMPQHLRQCFLSFGAFPEDQDIPVRKLLWLWVAEEYLMDLIRRSLVVVGKKGLDGAMKTCRIHDLLRDLCLKKAEEEHFPTNLQKLGLCGPLITKSGDLRCRDLGLLMHLEKLKLLNTIPLLKAGRLSTSIIFPENLKNLTVSNTYLDWKEAWVFAMILNLEVLKLKFHAFIGEEWETSPEAFLHLKCLKLDELDLWTWITSRNHFSVLQHLLVHKCPRLMEIPKDFGNICTLEWIELSGCSAAATSTARYIQKKQESNGNDGLKILINPGPTKPMHRNAGRSGY